MYALSVMQPHASLIIGEEKRIETRGYAPAFGFRGRIAIHASRGFPVALQKLCWETIFAKALLRCGIPEIHTTFGPLPNKEELPRGVILGTADLWDARRVPDEDDDDIVYRWHFSEQEEQFGDFSPKRWGWFFRNVVKFPKPIEASGALGLWQWNPPDWAKADSRYGLAA